MVSHRKRKRVRTASSQDSEAPRIKTLKTGSPEIDSTFTVSSGALCFGSLHNIWEGTLAPVQGFPKVTLQEDGTILADKIEYNFAAKDGSWNAYKLVNEESKVIGWFVAHSDIEPQREIARILEVASPIWEAEIPNWLNDERIQKAGIFLINHYDWSWYDRRSLDKIKKKADEESPKDADKYSSVGFVDFGAAKDMVRIWEQQKPSQRESTSTGLWMRNTTGDGKMYGRFGFDEERKVAQSFLFFSEDTYFSITSFSGLTQKLLETPRELYERRVREGYHFSGLDRIEYLTRPDGTGKRAKFLPPPPSTEQLGPYDLQEHILKEQDIEALRLCPAPEETHSPDAFVNSSPKECGVDGFADPWKEPVFDLLNEMILSYLERNFISKAVRGALATATKLFPGYRRRDAQMQAQCFQHFKQPTGQPIPSFDTNAVSARIRAFLTGRSQQTLKINDKEIAGICRVVAFLVMTVMERAEADAAQKDQTKVMPSNIRYILLFNNQLREILGYSGVYWNGREQQDSSAQ